MSLFPQPEEIVEAEVIETTTALPATTTPAVPATVTPAPKRGDDWFGRREEDGYTLFDKNKKTSNWDEGLTNYSDFFWGNRFTNTTNSKKARKMQNEETARLLSSMFRMMGVERMVPKSTKRDPEAIHIPTQLLSDPDKTGAEAADIFLGATLHAASEFKYSTKADRKRLTDAKRQLAGARGKDAIANSIFQVINDERIDQQLGNDCPGYTRFLQKWKEDRYDRKYEPPPADASANARLMDLFMKAVRFPKHITDEEIDEFGPELDYMKTLLEKTGGIPETALGCERLAQQVTQVIMDYVPPPPPPPPPSSGGGGTGPGGGTKGGGAGPGGSPGGSEEDDGSGAGSPPGHSVSGQNPGAGNTGDEDEDEDDSSSSAPAPEEEDENEEEEEAATAPPMKRPMEIEEELEELAKKLASLTEEEETDDDQTFKDFIEEVEQKEDEVELIDNVPVLYTRMTDDVATYNTVKSKLDLTKGAVIASLLRRKARDHAFVMKGMRSGRLDTNKIAEAAQSAPNIYERSGTVKTDKLTVVVLIDESGSMSGGKIKRAQESAIFLNEIFSKIPGVELFIYGHTTDEKGYKCNIHVYVEPGYRAPYALGSVTSHSCNRDGTAILAAGHRVRKFTQNQGIYIVISDGQPAGGYRDSYGGDAAIKHTKNAVDSMEKKGFQVIQIAIDSVDSKRMFKHWVKMTNIKDLPSDMAAFIKKKLNKLIKEKVSM